MVLRLVVPPVPVHASVYVVVAWMALIVWLPEVALLPLQPPEAVQLVALVLDQVSTELPPCATVAGLALRFTTGAVALPILTVTCRRNR